MSQYNDYAASTTEDDDIKALVDWKNPPTLRALKRDLSEAKASHNNQIEKVNRWMDCLRGKLKIKTLEGRSSVQPKLIRKHAEWRYAALEEPFLSANNLFKVYPATYQDVDAAKQNELILNKQFRVDIPRVSFINKYIRAAVNTGTAVIKLNWDTKTDVVAEEVPVFTETPEQLMMVIQQLLMQGQLDEQSAQAMLQSGQPIQIGTEVQQVEEEVFNGPVLQIRDCRNVIIDPSCEGDISNAQFIVDRFLTDLSTLKKDSRYSNLDKINPRDYVSASDSDSYYYENKQDPNFQFEDNARKKLVCYEYWGYWDIDGDGVTKPIVCTWVGDTVIRLEENPYPDKALPFVVVQYLPPDTDSVYGDADASLLEDNQNIIGAVTRAMIDLIARSANAQKGIRKDLLDPINRKRFNQGLDFEFNPSAQSIDQAMYMTKLPEIPRSALEVIQLQNNEAEALTGVKAFSGGVQSQSIGDSVGGIKSTLDSVAKREMSILRRLSDGLKEVGRKIIAMNGAWLSDEEVIRITDEEFVAIKRSDLAGKFDLNLDVSTAESDAERAQELAFMLQTVGNSIPFDITKILLAKIADLRKLPELAKAISEYQPQPDPIAQEAAQLNNEMLKAQINNEQAKGAENSADVQLKQAKTQTELSKARANNSAADKTDLDYIEQASGLQQERELEKQALGLQFKDRLNRQSRYNEHSR